MTKGVKKILYPMIAFLVSFLPRAYYSLQAYPLRTLSDELGTMAGGALLAGKNWSLVVSQGGYYGFGFTMLFAPVFRLFSDPFLIYRTILLGEVFLQSLVALLVFYMLTHFYEVKDEIYACLASIACSYMVVTRAMIVYNEHALIMCSYLCAFLLLKLIRLSREGQEKKKRIYSLLLAIVLGYSLLVHTRAIAYWAVLVVVLILYILAEKKSFLSLPVFVPSAAALYILGKRAVKLVQNILWDASSGKTVKNTEVKLHLSMDFLKPEGRGPFSSIVIGQMNTATMITGGFMMFAFVTAVYLTVKYLQKLYAVYFKKNQKILTKRASAMSGDQRNGVNVNSSSGVEWEYLMILLYFGMLTMGTILAQSFSWLGQTREAMALGQGSWVYGIKSLTYVRYMGPYLGPLVMATLAYAKKYENYKLALAGMVVSHGLQLVWFIRVFPYVCNNTYALECYLPFALQNIRNLDMTKNVYVPGTCIAALLTVFFLWAFRPKKARILAAVLAVFLMYQYCYNCVAYDLTDQKNNYKQINSSRILMNDLRIGKIQVDHIYVVDVRDQKDHTIPFLYQFYNNTYTVIPELPVKLGERDLLFSNGDGLLDNAYSFQLDENEFVYSGSEEMAETIRRTRSR